tara:strand:- start:508 stop:1023 length:516 start_codon:yes stop_codon:yes gene_type:complete
MSDKNNSNPTLVIKLKDGEVKITLFKDLAPNHVQRISQLAKEGKYNNVVFHRVIDGFMAQTGDIKYGNLSSNFDMSLAGTGGSSMPDLGAEFNKMSFERGSLGMARAQDPDSANSQFFIMFQEGSFLNGQYTLFGQVIEGMTYVDNIKRGDESNNGLVSNPDHMIEVIYHD